MDPAIQPQLCLRLPGFSYPDLHRPEGLSRILAAFSAELERSDPQLHREWLERQRPNLPAWESQRASRFLLALARRVGSFLSRLFGIEAEAAAVARDAARDAILFRFRDEVVRRRVLPLLKGGGPAALEEGDRELVEGMAAREPDRELALARAACDLLDRADGTGDGPAGPGMGEDSRRLAALERWCSVHLRHPAFRSWTVFRFAAAMDLDRLVAVEGDDPALPERRVGPAEKLRRRDGFDLTDPCMTPRQALGEVHRCLLCHERGKDSCSRGLLRKDGRFAERLGVELSGCPLHQRVSEMQALCREGEVLGALSLVMADNPLCPGTGHRICNDCMASCIFQKQEPVNVPQVETSLLSAVLRLPWGVEIYGLLTRWNPLNARRPHALPYHGIDVLVAGLGPAGYTLAHYLLNEGFGVVGIDGLKIEPLPQELTGGADRPPRPVRDWNEIRRPLEERTPAGFGGVSEYGITARWDKNFLTLLHLTLSRRERFRIYDGVRLGGTLRLEDVRDYGFRHLALAAGAGRPAVIGMRNNLLRGIRKASDFLMALQSGGAYRREALFNLQVRLPALVIGGGLTAVDAATEVLAYYLRQVEKTLDRYEVLCSERGETEVIESFDAEEREILGEFLEHGRAVRRERARARAAAEPPNFLRLLRSWGGASIVYRRGLAESPAYRKNHQEVAKALEEGVAFIERMEPEEALADAHGHLRAVRFRRTTGPAAASTVELPARSLLVAAGTTPNISYQREYPETFLLDEGGKFFQPHRGLRGPDGTMLLEPDPEGFFTSYREGGLLVSFYGDNHPRYAGSVVKAMASAREGYHRVAELFSDEIASLDGCPREDRDRHWRELVSRLDRDLRAKVEAVERLNERVVEVTVRAPAAARRFEPGQFFKLQNYEALAPRSCGTVLAMEGMALTGASVDRRKGLISLLVLEAGASSRLAAHLRPGEPVVCMGPCGSPTPIPEGRNAVLIGGGLGNAVLFIARALRERKNRVLYFAGYRRREDLFKREEIESSTDAVVWCTEGGAPIAPSRPGDRSFRGNLVEALLAWAAGRLGDTVLRPADVDLLLAIGSERMMAAVKEARDRLPAGRLKDGHLALASVNSPMQCMMKAVCGQCLQAHRDPRTGKESFVFSCAGQDQPLDLIDFASLSARLRQQGVQEKLANLWLDHLLEGFVVRDGATVAGGHPCAP